MTVQPTRDQLRALADAATPGPWNPHPAGKYVWTEDMGGIIQNWSDDANAVDDMEFIAAARTAVPQLLDQFDQAEAELDSWMTRAYEAEKRAWQAEARIKAVRDVHEESAPINKVGWTYCRHCTAPTAKTYVLYPCPTIRALESVPPPSA